MDGWYYAQNGQSVGPVSQAELKQLIAAGQVGGDDQVWHQSMANWMAAKKVPGLVARPAVAAPPQAAAPAYVEPQQQYTAPDAGYYAQQQQQGVIGYQGSMGGGDIVLTSRAMGFLRQTKPWAMFLAVLMFIGAGLCAIGAIFMLVGGSIVGASSRSRGGGAFAGLAATLSIVYFIIAFINFILGFYLAKFASSIGSLTVRRQPADLENAMQAQMSYWRLVGIITIVVIALYLIIFLFAIAGASRF
jgi:hypothetical protein